MTLDILQNRCFDEINIGDTASVSRTLSLRDVQLFAAVSGDISPTQLDSELDRQLGPSDLAAHGMWLGAQVSGLLGNQLPGPGTVHSGQDLEFLATVPIGEQVTITITATAKDPASRRVIFDCRGVNGRGETIMTGTARVIAPLVKVTMERPEAAQVSIQSHDRFETLVERCAQLPAVPVAVAHPCDESSLGAALQARREGLIEPILIGPLVRLRALAEEHGFDLSGVQIEDMPHSHAAAFRAVELVRLGKAAALMKGELHTDELMAEVVRSGTPACAPSVVSRMPS